MRCLRRDDGGRPPLGSSSWRDNGRPPLGGGAGGVGHGLVEPLGPYLAHHVLARGEVLVNLRVPFSLEGLRRRRIVIRSRARWKVLLPVRIPGVLRLSRQSWPAMPPASPVETVSLVWREQAFSTPISRCPGCWSLASMRMQHKTPLLSRCVVVWWSSWSMITSAKFRHSSKTSLSISSQKPHFYSLLD